MSQVIAIDNQPISATFFGEAKWLTEFITPNALEVQELYDEVIKTAENPDSLEDRMNVLWCWVADKVRYKRFIKGTIWIEGKKSTQNDLWNDPSTTIRVKVGNCANKAFLLCSLIRNILPADKVHTVLGNINSDGIGGHAWCTINSNGSEYILESTRSDVTPVLASRAEIYEPVVVFNDHEVSLIEGKVIKEPLGYCCVTWLKDYLDMNRCDEFIGR